MSTFVCVSLSVYEPLFGALARPSRSKTDQETGAGANGARGDVVWALTPSYTHPQIHTHTKSIYTTFAREPTRGRSGLGSREQSMAWPASQGVVRQLHRWKKEAEVGSQQNHSSHYGHYNYNLSVMTTLLFLYGPTPGAVILLPRLQLLLRLLE